MSEFHHHEWTPESVQFFWDNISKSKNWNEQYFTLQVGAGLLKYTARHVRIAGSVLDYGTGRGYLAERLLTHDGVALSVCDYSEESIGETADRLQQNANFTRAVHIKDIPIAEFESDSYDLIFFIETIEHLLDENYDQTLGELSRLCKPGGHIVITTRNEEDLDESKALCPECGAFFHLIQHVRTFSRESLAEEMSRNGFECVSCEATDLMLHTASLLSRKWLRHRFKRLFTDMPNLVYVGRKVDT